MFFFTTKKAAVQFVCELIQSSKLNSALTMTIVQEKSGGCYVTSAIDELSDDIEMQTYLKELRAIYDEEQAG